MRKCSALGAALIGVFAAILPANGEDAGIYAFIHSEARGRSYTPPLRVAPQIATRTLDFSPRRRSTRPAIARVPAVARVRVSKTVVDEPSPKITRDPKTIGEISNPLLALLADETLRPGDMVVFPDGVRVFRGKPGSRHQLPDFVKLTDTKRMASSDRKLVARIVIGQNPAWSFETGQPSKLAKSDQDVDETGSTRKAGRGR